MHCIALRCVALRRIALRCVALHCIALRCIALHCIALHCIHTYMHTYLVRVCEIGIVWYRLLLQGLTIRSERTSFCKSFVLTVCSNSGPSHGYHCHQVQIPLGGTRWHAPCHAPAVSRENVQDAQNVRLWVWHCTEYFRVYITATLQWCAILYGHTAQNVEMH